MRRFLISCAAGCLACTTAFAAPADAAAAFDATMKHLDKGGTSLYYTNIKIGMEQINLFLNKLEKTPTADTEELSLQQLVKLFRMISRTLNFDAFQAIGSSVKEMPNGLTRYRSFVYTGDNALQGILFDLAGRENRPLQLPALLPASTLLAFEYQFDFSTAWNNFSKTLAESPELPQEAKNVPASLEAACSAAGVELAALLKTLSGTWSLAVVAADPAVSPLPMLRLSVPDQNGALFKLLQEQGGLQLTTKEPGRYSVAGLPLPVLPELVSANGSLTLYSDARLEQLLKGGLIQSKESGACFTGMPAKGLGFFYLNINQQLWNLILMQIQEPAAATLLRNIPPPVFACFSTREKDGYASTACSNWHVTPTLGNIAILSGMLLPALSQAREKARQIQKMQQQQQQQAPAAPPAPQPQAPAAN